MIRSDSPAFFWTIASLLSECLDNNARYGITGVLIFCDFRFMQVLEGPEPAVDAVYARVRNDCRHTEVKQMSRTQIDSRIFPIWSMAFIGPPANVSPMFDMIDSVIDGQARHCSTVLAMLAHKVNGETSV